MPSCPTPDKVRLYPRVYIEGKVITALYWLVIHSKKRERRIIKQLVFEMVSKFQQPRDNDNNRRGSLKTL